MEGPDQVDVSEQCIVCGDRASGRHYGAISCEGCKGFFKRSIRKKLGYQCRGSMDCEVSKLHRNRCQYCRLQKCLASGMRSDSVQHERKPIVDKVKNENQATLLPNYSNLMGLAGPAGQGTQINPKEEPVDNFGAVAPASNNPILLAAAAVFKNNPVPPYLPSGPAADLESARHQQLLMQTQLAKNILKIGQFGALNEYLQSAYAATPQDVIEEEAVLCTLESTRLPLPLGAPPPPPPPPLRLHALCEAGARLLAAAARWAADVPAFRRLPFEVQVMTLRKCWAELFILSLAKFSQVLSLNTLIPQLVNHLLTVLRERAANMAVDNYDDEPERCNPNEVTLSDYSNERISELSVLLTRLQTFVAGLEEARPTELDHAYLRALCLFSPDGIPENYSKKFQNYQMKVLRSFRSSFQSEDEDRFASLLLKLPILRSFTPSFIEDVFFVSFVGDVNIDDVIPQLLNYER